MTDAAESDANKQGDSTQPKKEMAEIWLVADADHLLAMHDMIAVYKGKQTTIYECAEWQEKRPVEAVLGAAGFAGGAGSAVEVRATYNPGAGIVKYRGFAVEMEEVARLEMIIRMALGGSLGGWTGVVMSQVGFHRSIFAFEYVWAAAGMPTIMVRHPDFVGGSEGDRRPAPIFETALANPRHLYTLSRNGEVPEPEPEGTSGG
jgi:hypothetical protein